MINQLGGKEDGTESDDSHFRCDQQSTGFVPRTESFLPLR